MKTDWAQPIRPTLSVDVRSRLAGMFDLVQEVSRRVQGFPVLTDLLDDFKEMSRAYTMRFESELSRREGLTAGQKWLRRHEMLDKLTREWHLIYSLASATQLGSTVLGDYKPYVDQAVQDIGIDDPRDRFLLLPIFGESFSLVTVRYSTSNVAILKLPISVIHSPWELSVIWHEMAGLKVLRISDQVEKFLEGYATSHHIDRPEAAAPRGHLLTELLERIQNDRELDADFMGRLKSFLADPDGPGPRQDKIWSKDWFEQLYEDACSVFAFGEAFLPVLEKILRRQEGKLTADHKHPDLKTRLEVAQRLLQLRKLKGKENAPDPVTDAERLTDELLWAFIKQHESDPEAGLPVAFADPAAMPPVRQELVEKMTFFIEQFGDFAEIPVDLGALRSFEGPANEKVQQAIIEPESDRYTHIQERLEGIFGEADLQKLLTTPFSPSDELMFNEHVHVDRNGNAVQIPFWKEFIVDSGHGRHNVPHGYHG